MFKSKDPNERLTKKQIKKGHGIDPEIKDVIRELNDRGYKTRYSCSGHGSGTPYIIFKGLLDNSDIREVESVIDRYWPEHKQYMVFTHNKKLRKTKVRFFDNPTMIEE